MDSTIYLSDKEKAKIIVNELRGYLISEKGATSFALEALSKIRAIENMMREERDKQ